MSIDKHTLKSKVEYYEQYEKVSVSNVQYGSLLTFEVV